ncbi:hypothetical protein TYRP_010010 [Tyrophagus putrescentiae]|nr:hypothetical protein TYRP_010010 [Tyrophagus putrescentiae]
MAGLGNSGQTLNDRLNAARYALAGQGLARVVCKATTEEMIAPKKKHIDYLLQCTNEPNVSIPQLANLLIERTAHPNWVVVFKSLVTVHHLMCYGNERFTQYLASSNSNFQLNNYQDKSTNRGYDMSMFIRRYAKYLNTKALSYRTVAFDFTKIKRGGDGQLRAMNVEKLVKTVPMLQTQIDSLLEFDCTASDLTNGVINAAFFLLFKDLIRLFACYNDGIINCLEKYFEMTNKKMARETLEIYKKFLIRMNKVGDFLKTAENVGIDKGEIPDLTKAPSSLLDAMEQHLAQLEGKKPGTTTSTSNGENTEVSAKKAIEEEEQFLNKLKEKHVADKKPSSGGGGGSAAVSNPFLAMAAASPTAKSSDIIDLFGSEEGGAAGGVAVSKSPAEDLFSLSSGGPAPPAAALGEAASSNPFADILNAMGTVPGQTVHNAAAAVPGNNFATSDNFAAAFGNSSTSNLEETRSPTPQDRKSSMTKGAPSRPPPPPAGAAAVSSPGSHPSRPPPPKQSGGRPAGSPDDQGDQGGKAAGKSGPPRPPVPTGQTPVGSGASTPSSQQPPAGASFAALNPAQQLQQMMAMQQQCLAMMAASGHPQPGHASAADPAAMMAAQMAQMQAMFTAMAAGGGGGAGGGAGAVNMPNMAAMAAMMNPMMAAAGAGAGTTPAAVAPAPVMAPPPTITTTNPSIDQSSSLDDPSSDQGVNPVGGSAPGSDDHDESINTTATTTTTDTTASTEAAEASAAASDPDQSAAADAVDH